MEKLEMLKKYSKSTNVVLDSNRLDKMINHALACSQEKETGNFPLTVKKWVVTGGGAALAASIMVAVLLFSSEQSVNVSQNNYLAVEDVVFDYVFMQILEGV